MEGVSDDIVQGVRYTIDGTEQELNQDWWNDYAITLPDNISQVEIEAKLIGNGVLSSLRQGDIHGVSGPGRE